MQEVALGATIAVVAGIVGFVLLVVGIFLRHMSKKLLAAIIALALIAYLMI